MVVTLYYDEKGVPCRAVLLTIKALNLDDIVLQKLDLLNKESFTPEFNKINPQCTLPTFVDDDLILYDSHVISGYLVAKHRTNATLYPDDLRGRTLVDQKLHFNSGVLLPRLHNLLHPIIILGEKEIPKDKLDALKEGYISLNEYLEKDVFVAGEYMTIADFSCVASISTGSLILPISSEIYPNLFKWYQKCKELPYYEEANGIGLSKLDSVIESKMRNFSSKLID